LLSIVLASPLSVTSISSHFLILGAWQADWLQDF
jgi:hypothetical protein